MGRKISLNNTPLHQGWNILWYRSLNNWSQEDLEKKTGISQREISDYEDMSKIPDDKLEKFAIAFEIHVRYLRDVPSYASSQTILMFDNHGQGFGGDQTIHNHSIDSVKEAYEVNISRIIEEKDKHIGYLEEQITELKEEKKELTEKK